MIRTCKSEKDLTALLQSDSAMIFKHSTSCGSSAAAYDEIKLFDQRVHDTAVFVVRVIEERSISERVAERLGIRHESPQLIFVRKGKAIWHLSHRRITFEAIREKFSHES